MKAQEMPLEDSKSQDSLNSATGFKKINERSLHEGFVFRAVDASFVSPDGEKFDRELVYHPGAVAIVAIEDGKVVLVRQYRAPLDKIICEIPAGRCDIEGEHPEETARRELIEEAGLTCETLIKIGAFYNSPGFCDEITHIFLAFDLKPTLKQPDGPEEALMTVEMVNLHHVQAMIDRGEIDDAKTVIGLMLALQWLENKRADMSTA